MDLAEYSFGELVSNGFSGITTLAGGVGSVLKSGIKGKFGDILDFSSEKVTDYYIGERLKELKER